MPTVRVIPGKPRLPIARTSNYNYYYPAHAQRMRRSVTDIYIYIYIYIIESVDSINRDERGFPLTQYITNWGISRAR